MLIRSFFWKITTMLKQSTRFRLRSIRTTRAGTPTATVPAAPKPPSPAGKPTMWPRIALEYAVIAAS